MITEKRGFILGIMPLLALLVGGCGTNLDEILYQAFAATGRTALDVFLTDFANNLADQADADSAAVDDTGGGDGTGGGGATDGAGDSGGGGTDGDATDGGLDGAVLFAANCSACHGSDGASGFAPDITAATADELIVAMSLTTHESLSPTDDELTAIALFLGGGAPADGGGSIGGDAAVGETIFTANGCASCHCADASGGCALEAPSLHGVDGGTLDAVLRGDAPHTGGKHDLTDQDLLDLQVYLDGLS